MKKAIIFFTVTFFGSLFVFAQGEPSWNQIDSKGQKMGRWRAYHENGKLRYTGQFEEDQPYDEFRYYFTTGDLQSVLTFENSSTAKARLFYQNGDLMAEGTYKNQKREGKWTSYGDQNIKVEEGEYINGMKEGSWKTFFPNGKIASETNYINNLKEAEFKRYYDNGALKQDGIYENDKLNGLSTFYKPDGKKFLKGIYQNDMRDKNWIYYDDKMEVKNVLEYQEGVLMNPEELETIDYDSEPYRNNIKDVLEFDDLRGKIRYE